MLVFLCIMSILCFIMMVGSTRQQDRNNQTTAFCITIIAIMLIYFYK